MTTNQHNDVLRAITMEEITTLSGLSISDETLGKVIREALGRKISPGADARKSFDVKLSHSAHHKGVELEDHNSATGTIKSSNSHKAAEGKPIIVEVMIAGNRSTVSIPKSLFDSYVTLAGSSQEARRNIRNAVTTMPADTPKPSIWAQEFIKNKLEQ